MSPGREYGDLFSGPGFEHARDEVASRRAGELFAATSVAGMQLQPEGETIGARGNVQLVSGEYFTALRQQPQLGRFLAPSDNRTVGAHPVAVISDSYWQRHFNAAPDAVGRTLAINGTSFTVIGVTRPRFFGTTLALRAPDAWIPFMMQPVVRYSQNASNSNSADPRKPWPPQPEMAWLNVFVRVTGATAAAESAMTTVFQRDNEALLSKDASADDRAAIAKQRVILNDASTGLSSLRKTVSEPLYVVLAMVGVLLAIACGNVAGLLLSRAAGRAREMAIRQSIGARRIRLVRQMFAESLLLAVAAGFVGFTIAIWARDALLALMVNVGSSPVPLDLDTGLDARVLGFSLAVSTLTGIGCGVLPAFRGTRVPVAEALKQEGRGAVTEGGRRGLLIGKALVAVQMAFCLLLLVVAGLFTRSLRVLTQTDIGFDRAHVLTVRTDVRGAGYSENERQALYRRLVESLQAIPGVESASMSANGPMWGSQRISSLSVEGYTPGRDERLRTNEEFVTDRYFDTMGLKILEGRSFRAEDRAPGARNTVVNATMARRFFPNQSAIGKRWDYGDGIGKDSQVIVGVVEDARYVDVKVAPPNMAYSLAEASPDEVLGDIEIKTSTVPAALAQTVRETLARAEPRLPIVEVVALEDRLARGVIQDRMVARLTRCSAGWRCCSRASVSTARSPTASAGASRSSGCAWRSAPTGAWCCGWSCAKRWCWSSSARRSALPLAFVAGRSMGALLFNVGAADPIVICCQEWRSCWPWPRWQRICLRTGRRGSSPWSHWAAEVLTHGSRSGR